MVENALEMIMCIIGMSFASPVISNNGNFIYFSLILAFLLCSFHFYIFYFPMFIIFLYFLLVEAELAVSSQSNVSRALNRARGKN